MVMLDNALVLSDSQDLSGIGTTDTLATNVIWWGDLDSGNVGPNVGTGVPIYLVTLIESVFTGSAIVVNLFSDTEPTMSSPVTEATAYTLATTDAAGTVHIFTFPPRQLLGEYITVRYEPEGTVTDSGAIVTTFLTRDIEQWAARASGLNFYTP